MIIDRTREMYGESPTGSAEQGKIINDFHVQRLTKLIDSSGGKTIYGGKTNISVKHIEPTVILNPTKDSPLMNEEIFGPILPILTYKNLEEATSYINEKPKPLAIYFYGQSSHRDFGILQTQTSSGAILANECFMQIVSHY